MAPPVGPLIPLNGLNEFGASGPGEPTDLPIPHIPYRVASGLINNADKDSDNEASPRPHWE